MVLKASPQTSTKVYIARDSCRQAYLCIEGYQRGARLASGIAYSLLAARAEGRTLPTPAFRRLVLRRFGNVSPLYRQSHRRRVRPMMLEARSIRTPERKFLNGRIIY